jgi:hypothetical protein
MNLTEKDAHRNYVQLIFDMLIDAWMYSIMFAPEGGNFRIIHVHLGLRVKLHILLGLRKTEIPCEQPLVMAHHYYMDASRFCIAMRPNNSK